MPPAPLLGRDAELRALSRHAAAARPRGPGIAIVAGGAGMGKSSLLDTFAAGLTGHLVVRLNARARPLVAALAAGLGVRVDDRPNRPHVAGQRLLAAVSAADEPVTILVDDADRVDTASADTIGFAARRLFGKRVLLVLATQDDHAEPVTRMLPARGDLLRLRLSGLSAGDIQTIAHTYGLVPFTLEDAELLRQHSGGSPRYVTGLLTEVSRDPHVRSGGRPPVLHSVTEAITQRITRLPPASRALLAALSVLDDRCPLATVAGVAGVTEPLRALEPLLAAGLVQWWPADPTTPVRIRTPVQQQATYHATAPMDRQALHERAAAAVPSGRALVHRLRAVPGSADSELAADVEAAAWRWIGEGNLDRAAQHLLWAADVSGSGADHDHRLLLAVSMLQRAGRYEAAAALRERAMGCGPSPLRGIVLGRFAMVDGDVAAALDLLEPAVAETDGDPFGPRHPAVAALGLWWLSLAHAALGRSAEAMRAAARCLAISPFGRRIDRGTELHYLQCCAELEGPLPAAAKLRELAVLPQARSEVDPADTLLLVLRGHFRLLLGRPAEAAADLEAGLRTARESGIGELDDWAHVWAATAYLVLDDGGRAAAHARAALRIALAEGRPHLPCMLAVNALVEAQAGELAAAAGHAADAADLAENFSPGDVVFPALAAAAVARAKGDSGGVVDALRSFGGWRTGWLRTYRWLWWPMHVDALLELGRVTEAQGELAEMAHEITAGFRVLAVPHRYLAGRAAEATGDLAAARASYQRAINAPSAQAHADWRAVAAQAHQRIARRGVTSGATVRGDDPAAGRLTSRERAIAGLIADGLSNRAVSTCLGIAEKTIEAHLTRMYRKLSVKSRHELRAALPCARSGSTSYVYDSGGPTVPEPR